MKIVVDSSVLAHLLSPRAGAPIDRSTGKPVAHCQERIESLLEGLDASGAQLIIPTPVLSELLIKAEGRELEILAILTNKRSVQVCSFDQMAAVENAMLRRAKVDRRGSTKKEVSFDLQILAIARVVQASVILTDDENLQSRCGQAGMQVLTIADIPVHDSKRQIGMFSNHGADACETEERVENDPPPVLETDVDADAGPHPERGKW